MGTAHRVLAGGLLTAGVLLLVWYLVLPTLRTQPSGLSTEAAPAALPLPDKPSIVVLPLVNMSNDHEQDYFSDGITEDITADLSKISGLFVIARNSAFTYKGKAVRVQDVSREMGVRYVLEGSVRRAGDQVRITAQLIDGPTGGHVWSERYDRPLKDIFAVQDEIRQQIVANLRVEVQEAELVRVRRIPTENLTAYDLYLRSLESLLHAENESNNKEANIQARQIIEKTIALDPQYAAAYTLLSFTYLMDWFRGWNRTPQVLERWREVTRKALALDASLPAGYFSLAWLSLFQRQFEQAIAAAKQAIALDPNSAEGYFHLATILNFAGQPGESIEWIKQAVRLNPRYRPAYLSTLGWAHVVAGRYGEALVPLKQALPLMPDNLTLHWALVVCYVELGREQEARATAAEMLRINPQFSTEVVRPFMPNKDPRRTEHVIAALRKAGLK